MCGVSAISGGLGIAGGIAGLSGGSASRKYEKRLRKRVAQINLRVAKEDAAAQNEKYTKDIASLQTQSGGSGFTVEGSPTEILTDAARDRSVAKRTPVFKAKYENALAKSQAGAPSAARLQSNLGFANDAFSYLTSLF